MSRQSAALSPATQHTMPPELGGKWGTKCLNTRFSLPTLLYAGYSVKLNLFYILIIRYNETVADLILIPCSGNKTKSGVERFGVVGSIYARNNELLFINIFISSLLYNMAKRGVEFHHSTNGEQSVLPRNLVFRLPTMLYTRYLKKRIEIT